MSLTLKHGNPLMVDYTPTVAVVAGEVEVIGEIPYIAHNPIDANDLGALAAGGGVYEGTSDGTVDNPGVDVYWDAGASKITTTVGANKHLGQSLPDQGASNDGDTIRIHHNPNGGA